jgi:hypothetical protein
MLHRDIRVIPLCSQIHTKHVNTLCGQNVVFLSVKHEGMSSYHWSINNILILQIYQVFTPVVNQKMAFLSLTPCSVTHLLRDFGSPCFLHLRGDGILCRWMHSQELEKTNYRARRKPQETLI